MDTQYVIIRSDTKSISNSMSKTEAINMVKEYNKQGISVYIVSEDEGNRIKSSSFNTPKWT